MAGRSRGRTFIPGSTRRASAHLLVEYPRFLSTSPIPSKPLVIVFYSRLRRDEARRAAAEAPGFSQEFSHQRVATWRPRALFGLDRRRSARRFAAGARGSAASAPPVPDRERRRPFSGQLAPEQSERLPVGAATGGP